MTYPADNADEPDKKPENHHVTGQMSMGLPEEQAAKEIEQVGVEGRPPDPKRGPGWVWSELGAALAIVICLAGLLGWAIGWAAGVAALALSLVAIVLNPVISASLIRAHDRQIVVRRHEVEGPSTGPETQRVKKEQERQA